MEPPEETRGHHYSMETRVLYTIEVTTAREERCNSKSREKGKRTMTAKGMAEHRIAN